MTSLRPPQIVQKQLAPALVQKPIRQTLYAQFVRRLIAPLSAVLVLAIVCTVITSYQLEEKKQTEWRTLVVDTLGNSLKKPLWDCDDMAAQKILDSAQYLDINYIELKTYCTKSTLKKGNLDPVHDENHYGTLLVYEDENKRELPVGEIAICFAPPETLKKNFGTLWRYLLIIGAMALALCLGSLQTFRVLISQPLAAFNSAINKRCPARDSKDLARALPLTERNDELTDVVKAYDVLIDTVAAQRLALERQVRIDPLTGLGNRIQLEETLTRALAEAQNGTDKKGFVLLIDLNKFKPINDTLGHAAGDMVLQATAQRLLCAVQPGDSVIRLGGDEFVIIVKPQNPPADVKALTARIAYLLAAPLDYQGTAVTISASTGVAAFPDDGTNSDALLKQADNAMYSEKSANRRSTRR